MRNFTFAFFALLLSAASQAQTVANFDSLLLPAIDTYYVNYSNPGNDVGFDDGKAHFPCIYDTSWGFSFLSYGFVYSNKTDSFTSGFENQFSAKAGSGYYGSDNYIVAYGSYNKVHLLDEAMGKKVYGFYITNNTYTHNSMRDGDAFAKKFGGASGLDSDWFKLTIRGYYNGTVTNDSVEFYLADFRGSNDYIVDSWKWVNLLPLGDVDSLDFSLSSSDNGMFGMNTPAYFCMDHFMTREFVSVGNVDNTPVAKIYPNPATDKLYVQLTGNDIKKMMVVNTMGTTVAACEVKDALTSIDISLLPKGTYLLQLVGENQRLATRFVKQ